MRRLLHHRLGKLGMPPGALVRVPDTDRPPAEPTILIVDYPPEELDDRTLVSIDEAASYIGSAHPTWIDISGAHPLAIYQKLGELAGLHALTLEDMLNTDQRPKTEEFDHYLFVVLKKPSFNPVDGHLDLEQVSIILTSHTVFSLHETVPTPASPTRSRLLSEQDRIRKLGTDYLAYVIIDSVVDDYFVAMERLEDRIQDLEAELTETATSATMRRIHRLQQDVIQLRRSVWPLREVIGMLTKTTSSLFDERIEVYLKDLQDHILQVVELIDVYREMLVGSLNMYLSLQSHKMNQIMKTLTMIASLFIPLTLVTGIYGMNFIDMPELHWAYGYPFTLGIMLVIAAGMLWFFRRRGWL